MRRLWSQLKLLPFVVEQAVEPAAYLSIVTFSHIHRLT